MAVCAFFQPLGGFEEIIRIEGLDRERTNRSRER